MKVGAATVGVSDHGRWAMLVTVGPCGGTVLDRCKADLKDETLPGLPHHDASRRLDLPAAVALVEEVRLSARRHAPRVLSALEHRLGREVGAIALRTLPTLPNSVAERITNPWANARADGVMFREELAAAARALGWAVGWFDGRRLEEVTRSRGFIVAEADASRRFAPPWNKDCRVALAGGLAVRLAEERQ